MILHTASSVNYLTLTGGATGNAVTIAAAGSNTDIDIAVTPKGTAYLKFGTHTGSADAPVSGYITIKIVAEQQEN